MTLDRLTAEGMQQDQAEEIAQAEHLTPINPNWQDLPRLTSQERKELNQLQTNPAILEKYAREKYYMKRDNEDLFIIPTENKKLAN